MDEDVNRYFQRFQLLPHRWPPVTAASLLTHTSGIENWFLGTLVKRPSEVSSLEEYYAHRPPRTVQIPRTELTYSNQGMALAGYLVEAVSRQPFADYADINIFRPLGMLHATFRQRYAPAFRPYPAAALTCTVIDMGQFLRMQLNGGRVGEHQVLRPETVADMQRQHWTAHAHAPGIAYGFFESFWNGERLLFHTGDSGDHSLFLLDPSRGWGLYFVYRGGGENAEKLREEFIGFLMNHYYPAPKFQLPTPKTGQADLRKYAGLHRASNVDPYTLEKVLGISRQIHIQVVPGGYLRFREFGVRAVEVEPNLFRIEDGGYLSFRHAADGHITGGTVTGSIWDPESFDRISGWENGSLQFIILGICVFILFSSLPWAAVDAIRRRRRPKVQIARSEDKLAALGWRLSAYVPLILLLGLVCFLANLLVWRPPITGIPPGGLVFLGCLLAASVVCLAMPVFAVLAWRRNALGVTHRVYLSVFSLAGIRFAAVLFYWNLLGFKI